MRNKKKNKILKLQNLRVLIENAKDGVIFISWGGNIKASSLPNNKVRAILRALARFPQQIIWKWEDDTINDIKSDNVHIFNWLPQRDILGEYVIFTNFNNH